jgi:hypothetical protein
LDDISADDPNTRLILRHLLATLAYRAGKAVRGTPAAYADCRLSPDSRTPAEILAHMGDLMDWVLSMLSGEQSWKDAAPLPWEEEIRRFFAALARVDEHLESGAPILWNPGRVMQGGIADALTHTGQLAMLRRLSGHKMKGENYARAQVAIGRVGLDQAASDPAYEFD